MGRPSGQYDTSGVPQCSAVKAERIVQMDVLELYSTLHNHHMESPNRSYGTVYANKMDFLVQKSIQLFLKKKFRPTGFPHNLAKNDRHDLKMGYIDASRGSRRQLQLYKLCSKLGSKLIFRQNYVKFSFANPVLDFVRIFPIVILEKVGPDKIYAQSIS